jgi:hypothetical protein
MPPETPHNVGYLVAAYVVAPVILAGYLAALWGRMRRVDGGEGGRSEGQAVGGSGGRAGGRSDGRAGRRSDGRAGGRSEGPAGP